MTNDYSIFFIAISFCLGLIFGLYCGYNAACALYKPRKMARK